MKSNCVAYGVDLAGYSTGKSYVAKVNRVDSSTDCYLRASIIPTDLLKKYEGKDELKTVVQTDVEVFSHILTNGGVCAVDVPIDLQGLNQFSREKVYIWELTQRPIDYKLKGLPPLAALIGAVVARMQLIMQYFPDALGKTIFETYPAASLTLLNEKQQYKGGKAQWLDGTWIAKRFDNTADRGLGNILNRLCVVCSNEGLILTDDEFDAILSAIPLLESNWLTGDELIKHPLIAAEYLTKEPTGYILCRQKFWSRIEII